MRKNARLKVYVEFYGCAANKADTETMITLILKAGHNLVSSVEKADVVLINTCAVKGPTERRMINRIKKLSKKPLVVAGCLPLINPKLVEGYSVITPWSIGEVVEALEKTFAGEKVKILKGSKPFLISHFRFNPVVEIIPIAEGCLGNCSYCAVRFARGRLRSYPEELIIRRAKRAMEEGVKEIWLTSQDCGAYGLDINSDIIDLLRKLIKLKGNFKIRLGMANPNFILKVKNELLKIFKARKMFRFLHIPVQSGSNKVLAEMNRRYRVEDVIKIVKAFKKLRTTIATDIIVGYPTETEDDFQKTIDLLKKIKPDVTNVSKFEARPGTPAAKLKPLPSQVIKERSRRISELVREISYERNKEWLGWKGKVLVDEAGKGRNYAYKQVVVNAPLGSEVKVRIVGITHTSLIGKIING